MTDSDTAFPTEVYELIIDYAGQAIDVPFLRACALVCRSWYPRARYHLLRSVQLLNKSDVLSFVRMVRHDRGPMGLTNVKEMVNRLFIRGTEPNANEAQEGKKDEVVDVLRSRSRRSLVHLGTCAAMLAGRAKLYNLTYLGIADGEWKDMHRNVGLHLSAAFPRVQWVDLFNVKFRSTTDFGRFLCAFKSLVHLGFWVSPRRQAAFKDDQGAPFNPVTFTDVKALTNLKRLTLNGRYSTRKLAEYFIATGLATQFIELKLGYYEHIPLAEVAPLIGAATSLLGLDIALDRMDRDASAMQNAFEPTGASSYFRRPSSIMSYRETRYSGSHSEYATAIPHAKTTAGQPRLVVHTFTTRVSEDCAGNNHYHRRTTPSCSRLRVSCSEHAR